jgi:hypothetical protein
MACAYLGQLVLAGKYPLVMPSAHSTYSTNHILRLLVILYGISCLPWSTGPFVSDGRTFGDAAIFIYIALACCGAFFLVCAIPYLIAKPKDRQGPPFPSGTNYLTIGWKSVGQTLRYNEKKKAKPVVATLMVLFFLLGKYDGTGNSLRTF